MGHTEKSEKGMTQMICGVKMMEKNKEVLMNMLELEETVDCLARGNGVRWYRHVLHRSEGDVLRSALDFKVNGKGRENNQKQHGKGKRKKRCMRSWINERNGN